MAKRHTTRESDWGSILCRLEELVIANTGQDAFEEVFKLLVAKYWAERENRTFGVLTEPNATSGSINLLLKAADAAWPGLVADPFTGLSDAHLSICIQVLEGHVISAASFEILDAAFEHLVSLSSKGSKGQFFTPRHVIEFCIRMIKPRVGELICDPSCGSGAFLIHARNHLLTKASQVESGRINESLWGFDFDPRAIRVAKALSLFAGAPEINLVQLNSLLNPKMQVDLFAANAKNGPLLSIEDVTRDRGIGITEGCFDVILTNPPFAGEIKETALLESFSLHRPGRRTERDILFIERCIDLLKPSGRIAIVLPHNKVGGDSFAYLREWLIERLSIVAVVGLGRTTFLPHTHQKASVIFGYKRTKIQTKIRPEPIFFAVSEREGKDSKGRYIWNLDKSVDSSMWDRVDHDLAEVVEQFEAEMLPQCPTWGIHVTV